MTEALQGSLLTPIYEIKETQSGKEEFARLGVVQDLLRVERVAPR